MLGLSEVQNIGMYVLYSGRWNRVERISIEEALFLAELQKDQHGFVVYPKTSQEASRLRRLASLELVDSYEIDGTCYGLSDTAKTASYVPFLNSYLVTKIRS